MLYVSKQLNEAYGVVLHERSKLMFFDGSALLQLTKSCLACKKRSRHVPSPSQVEEMAGITTVKYASL